MENINYPYIESKNIFNEENFNINDYKNFHNYRYDPIIYYSSNLQKLDKFYIDSNIKDYLDPINDKIDYVYSKNPGKILIFLSKKSIKV